MSGIQPTRARDQRKRLRRTSSSWFFLLEPFRNGRLSVLPARLSSIQCDRGDCGSGRAHVEVPCRGASANSLAGITQSFRGMTGALIGLSAGTRRGGSGRSGGCANTRAARPLQSSDHRLSLLRDVPWSSACRKHLPSSGSAQKVPSIPTLPKPSVGDNHGPATDGALGLGGVADT